VRVRVLPPRHRVLVEDAVRDLSAVEARLDPLGRAQRQAGGDLGTHRLRRSGGERHDGHAGKVAAQLGEPQEGGPEIVPPRDAAVRTASSTASRSSSPLRHTPMIESVTLRFCAVSGATYSRSSSGGLLASSAKVARFSDADREEEMDPARTPRLRSVATWSSISARSGLTTTTRPLRSSAGIW